MLRLLIRCIIIFYNHFSSLNINYKVKNKNDNIISTHFILRLYLAFIQWTIWTYNIGSIINYIKYLYKYHVKLTISDRPGWKMSADSQLFPQYYFALILTLTCLHELQLTAFYDVFEQICIIICTIMIILKLTAVYNIEGIGIS